MLAPSQFKQLIVSCGMELYYSGDLVVIVSQEDRDNDLEYYQSAQNIPWPIVRRGFFAIFVAHASPPMCSRLMESPRAANCSQKMRIKVGEFKRFSSRGLFGFFISDSNVSITIEANNFTSQIGYLETNKN